MGSADYRFIVRVNCITFNHAPFIYKALDGFCMQETVFPFVCVIVDDASTDGEQELLMRYLERNFELGNPTVAREEETNDYKRFFAQHSINKNCYFSVYLLKHNHYTAKKSKRPYLDESIDAKYVAMCEGDDYWIHPLKLQKQVDFLETHPDHSACIHAHRRDEYVDKDILSTSCYKYPSDVEIIPIEDIICNRSMFCATSSWCYRSCAVANYPDWAKQAPVGDKPLKLVLCSKGEIGYINEEMSVYRVGIPGSWTKRVLRNREAEMSLRRGLLTIMRDFDKWTEGKFHKYVKRNLWYYRYTFLKTDFIIRPYLLIKGLLYR